MFYFYFLKNYVTFRLSSSYPKSHKARNLVVHLHIQPQISNRSPLVCPLYKYLLLPFSFHQPPSLSLSLLLTHSLTQIMLSSPELPDCNYQNNPVLITPNSPTPKHSLYLSNLDDQKFLRFSIKYLYLFKKSVSVESLKCSLSKVLVDYYPLAGRLRASSENDQKLEVDCNGEGALFAEAFMDITAEDFLELSGRPNRSWRKLLYRVEARSFLDVPPLVIQVRFPSNHSFSSGKVYESRKCICQFTPVGGSWVYDSRISQQNQSIRA